MNTIKEDWRQIKQILEKKYSADSMAVPEEAFYAGQGCMLRKLQRIVQQSSEEIIVSIHLLRTELHEITKP